MKGSTSVKAIVTVILFNFLYANPSVIAQEIGTLQLKDRYGDRFDYEGELKNGKATGEGVAKFENGNQYEGGFLKNFYQKYLNLHLWLTVYFFWIVLDQGLTSFFCF